MRQEMSLDDVSVLENQLHVALVELWVKPFLAPGPLKRPGRYVTNNEDLGFGILKLIISCFRKMRSQRRQPRVELLQ